MRKGFTLVELSIVLVIIGLLIGGILVAQSMITTAKIQRFERELGAYQIAINNFHMNFKTYPGASAFFSPPGVPSVDALGYGDVDGDGVADAVECNGALSNHEAYQVWAHLSEANMIDTPYSPYSDSGCPGGTSTNSDWFQGKISPITQLSGAAAQIYGKTLPMYVSKDVDQYFRINFTIDASWVIPIEQKLGSTPVVFYYQANPGSLSSWLYNGAGVGMCVSSTGIASCTDSTAQYGSMSYVLAPL